MKRVVIAFWMFAGLAACKRGTHQEVQLKNASSETIYFVISADSMLSNPNDIARIRPITFVSDLSRISNTALKEEDQERIKENLFRYRIEDLERSSRPCLSN